MLSWILIWTAAVLADDSLLWGPYRPGLYFGMRPRIPETLLSGLMWYETSSVVGLNSLRHECTNNDAVSRFGWTAYDARKGGRQVIHDDENHVVLTTDLVKSDDGLAWEVRVRGDQPADNVLNLVWYAELESAQQGSGDFLALSTNSRGRLTPQGIAGDVELIGSCEKLGGAFRMTVTEGSGRFPVHSHPQASEKRSDLSHYLSLQVPVEYAWQLRDVYLTFVQDQVNKFLQTYGKEDSDVPLWSVFTLPDSAELGGNTHYIQKSFKGPFEFSIRFQPALHGDWPATSFDDRLDAVLAAQAARFNASLALQTPYTEPRYYDFAREMISSIAGGVGYFYGDSLVRDGDEVVKGPTRELFTGTPSRTFFPRGFYWDEGLNALALLDYDTDLVLQIINSWFATMDEDGWIEREQILGDEARARVPPEFQVQDPDVANPPTLVMALAHLGQVSHDPKLVDLLRSAYPGLQKHFEWLRRTQSGETSSLDRDFPSREAYRWRGRTPTHILASGIDDYPRAPVPNDGELHVDLVAWVGAMARSLSQVAATLGRDADVKYYEKVLSGVQRNLEKVFWSETNKAFCDITLDDFEEDAHECHIGYVTHLPFMLKLVPSGSPHLVPVLEQLSDPAQLWTHAGIRSLSKKDALFGTDENYWRGAVWNNMNFLTLDALRFYASPESDAAPKVKALAARIYRALRHNVVDNIYEQWLETGYVWESYDGITGAAKGAKAFTGWAGLVANIMAMPDTLDVDPVHDEV